MGVKETVKTRILPTVALLAVSCGGSAVSSGNVSHPAETGARPGYSATGPDQPTPMPSSTRHSRKDCSPAALAPGSYVCPKGVVVRLESNFGDVTATVINNRDVGLHTEKTLFTGKNTTKIPVLGSATEEVRISNLHLNKVNGVPSASVKLIG